VKIKVELSIGYGCKEDIIDIPDDEIKGLSDEDIESICEDYLEEWSRQYISTAFRIIE